MNKKIYYLKEKDDLKNNITMELNSILKDNKIKTILLMGAKGGGKSSIIASVEKLNKQNFLKINFRGELNKISEEEDYLLRYNIINQIKDYINYQEDKNLKKNYFILFLSFFLMVFIILFFIIKIKLKCINIFLYIILYIIIFLNLYLIVKIFKNKIQIQNVKIKIFNKIEFDLKKADDFEKALYELLNRIPKKTIIVIEDLDRYSEEKYILEIFINFTHILKLKDIKLIVPIGEIEIPSEHDVEKLFDYRITIDNINKYTENLNFIIKELNKNKTEYKNSNKVYEILKYITSELKERRKINNFLNVVFSKLEQSNHSKISEEMYCLILIINYMEIMYNKAIAEEEMKNMILNYIEIIEDCTELIKIKQKIKQINFDNDKEKEINDIFMKNNLEEIIMQFSNDYDYYEEEFKINYMLLLDKLKNDRINCTMNFIYDFNAFDELKKYYETMDIPMFKFDEKRAYEILDYYYINSTKIDKVTNNLKTLKWDEEFKLEEIRDLLYLLPKNDYLKLKNIYFLEYFIKNDYKKDYSNIIENISKNQIIEMINVFSNRSENENIEKIYRECSLFQKLNNAKFYDFIEKDIQNKKMSVIKIFSSYGAEIYEYMSEDEIKEEISSGIYNEYFIDPIILELLFRNGYLEFKDELIFKYFNKNNVNIFKKYYKENLNNILINENIDKENIDKENIDEIILYFFENEVEYDYFKEVIPNIFNSLIDDKNFNLKNIKKEINEDSRFYKELNEVLLKSKLEKDKKAQILKELEPDIFSFVENEKPRFKNSGYLEEFLELLKSNGFIISYNKDKGGYIIKK